MLRSSVAAIFYDNSPVFATHFLKVDSLDLWQLSLFT